LPNLQETAKFIKENKHLPGGVPKTTDTEENGLSLGEMNRVLMQKVHLPQVAKHDDVID